MPSKNIKNIPRRVNLDDDLRLLENFDLRGAENIRIMSSASSDAGTVENIKSTVEIGIDGKPAGTNRCIGTIAHPEKNDLYVFFHNSNNDHFIARYNGITESARVVISNPILKFTRTSFINGFAITGNNATDTLLYWTDNVREPRQINVTKAERHTDGDYVNGYPNPLTEEYIQWIKIPPTTSPSFVHGRDESVVYNNLSKKSFQFRYRYLHKDGQYTAYSPISDVTVSPIQLLNDTLDPESDLYFNYVDITFKNGNYDVDKIELCVREGNTGEWLVFREVENDASTQTQSIRFYDDDKYTVANQEDNLKNYDAVPLKARTAEYVANRAVLGNAVDGYNDINQNDLDNKVTFNTRYLPNNDNQFLPISTSGTLVEITPSFVYEYQLIFNTSSLTIDFTDNIILDFEVCVEPAINDPNYLFFDRYRFEWTAGINETLTTFLNDAIAYFTNLQTTGSTIVNAASNQSGNLRIDFRSRVSIPDGDASTFFIKTSRIVKSSKGYSSFKAGAKHPLGIVYYDKYGRAGNVQKPKDNAPYAKFFSERFGNEERGVTRVDWRIGVTPPIWAHSYQIVYGGNSSVGKFLQYTTAGIYYDVNSASKDSNKNIYISFNNFLGSDGSHADAYVQTKNPLLDYSFTEGDRIRIIKKPESNGVRSFVTEYLDLKILGFEYFEQNRGTSPIYQDLPIPFTTDRTKSSFGWTFIVEDPEKSGWSYDDVKNGFGNSNWEKGIAGDTVELFSNTCLIEIYNPKNKNQENVFYEFGEEFEIGNAGTTTRYHKGVRDQGTNVLETVKTIESNQLFSSRFNTKNYIEIDYGNNEPNIYVGDKIKFTVVNGNTPSGTYTVQRKILNTTNGYWRFYLNNVMGTVSISDVSTVYLDTDYLYAAGSIDHGDVWYRIRLLITGIVPYLNRERFKIIESVEDYYANDFYESAVWNRGRMHLYSPYAQQRRRKATVWISEPLFAEDNVNGLSSFNLAGGDLPFQDYDRSLGSIQLLKRRGDELIMYQENKVSKIFVGKDTLKTGDGANIVMLSGAVLGVQQPYGGDYGICENPESFAEKDGRHYFVDIKRGKVMRLSMDGLTPISDNKFSSLLDDLSRQYMRVINSSNLKIYGGFDREFDEYNITFEEVRSNKILVNGVQSKSLVPKVTEDGTDVVIEIERFEKGENIKTVSDATTFPTDSLYDHADYKSIVVNGIMTLREDSLQELEREGTLTVAIEIEGSVLNASANMERSTIEIPRINGSGGSDEVSTILERKIDPITIVFHEGSNFWIGYRSYKPNGYGAINYKFFGFSNGIHEHNSGANYNTFYGTSYNSSLTPVLKDNPSELLVLNSLSLESNMAFDVTSIFTNIGTTSFDAARFEQREMNYYADVPKAITTSNSRNSNVVGVGVVTASTTNTKTFAAGIAGLNLMVGDTLYNNTSTTNLGAITAIDYETNTITHTTGGGANLNVDFFYAVKSAKDEGEPIRGHAFRVTLKQPDAVKTAYMELFAVNGNVSKSNLTLDI